MVGCIVQLGESGCIRDMLNANLIMKEIHPEF